MNSKVRLSQTSGIQQFANFIYFNPRMKRYLFYKRTNNKFYGDRCNKTWTFELNLACQINKETVVKQLCFLCTNYYKTDDILLSYLMTVLGTSTGSNLKLIHTTELKYWKMKQCLLWRFYYTNELLKRSPGDNNLNCLTSMLILLSVSYLLGRNR